MENNFNKFVQPLWKSKWQFPRKLGTDLPQNAALALLGTYAKDSPSNQKDTFSTMFIAALFGIARKWKQFRCPSTQEWIKKMYCIDIMEYYSVTKIWTSFAEKWRKLEKK